MLHYLTIGILDADAVLKRQRVPLAPLPEELFGLLDDFRDKPEETSAADVRFEGFVVSVHPDFIQCPWYAPKLIRRSLQFARAATDLGCIVADVSHGRVLSTEELDTLINA